MLLLLVIVERASPLFVERHPIMLGTRPIRVIAMGVRNIHHSFHRNCNSTTEGLQIHFATGHTASSRRVPKLVRVRVLYHLTVLAAHLQCEGTLLIAIRHMPWLDLVHPETAITSYEFAYPKRDETALRY